MQSSKRTCARRFPVSEVSSTRAVLTPVLLFAFPVPGRFAGLRSLLPATAHPSRAAAHPHPAVFLSGGSADEPGGKAWHS